MLRCVVSGLRVDGMMGGGVGLAVNHLRAEGARALEPALQGMPQLTHLALGSECSGLVVLRWLVCWLLVLSAALCGEWAESGWRDGWWCWVGSESSRGGRGEGVGACTARDAAADAPGPQG